MQAATKLAEYGDWLAHSAKVGFLLMLVRKSNCSILQTYLFSLSCFVTNDTN